MSSTQNTHLKASTLSSLISLEFRPQTNWFSATSSTSPSCCTVRLLYWATASQTDLIYSDRKPWLTNNITIHSRERKELFLWKHLWLIPTTVSDRLQNVQWEGEFLQVWVGEALWYTSYLHQHILRHLCHWAKGLQNHPKTQVIQTNQTFTRITIVSYIKWHTLL